MLIMVKTDTIQIYVRVTDRLPVAATTVVPYVPIDDKISAILPKSVLANPLLASRHLVWFGHSTHLLSNCYINPQA